MDRLLIFIFIFITTVAFPQKADSLKIKLGKTEGAQKAKVHNELFRIYVNSAPTQALDHARLAYEIAAEADDKKGVAASLNNLGIVYKNQGRLDKALDYYIRSLRISTEIDNKRMMASTLNNIGTIYSLENINDKALIYFLESYEIFKVLGDNENLIGAYNNIGNAYYKNGLADKALEFYKESINLNHQVHQEQAFFDALNNIGNIYYQENEFDSALNSYRKAYEVAVGSGNLSAQALSKYNTGLIFFEQGKIAEAEAELSYGFSIAEQVQNHLIMKNTMGTLHNLYSSQKRYKEAYEALLLHDKYEDVLFNEESSRKIGQMEIALEFEEKEKELEVLRKQTEIDKLTLANSRIIVILSIMGVFILISGLFIYFKLYWNTDAIAQPAVSERQEAEKAEL